MFNAPLFKASFKKTSKLMLGITAIVIFYLLATAGMYDPSGESDLVSSLPEALRDAFGMELGPQTMEGFLATGFYGVSFLLFMIIFSLIVANQLLVNLVDRGSMAYLLTTPVARKKVAGTQAGVIILNLFLIVAATALLGLAGISGVVPDADLNISVFLQINIVAFCLLFFISGYAFFFSAAFNETKFAMTASVGLTMLFYVFNVFANSAGNAEWLKYLTVFSTFQPLEIVKGNTNVFLVSFSLGVAGLMLFLAGIRRFSRRDLPL